MKHLYKNGKELLSGIVTLGDFLWRGQIMHLEIHVSYAQLKSFHKTVKTLLS